MKRQYKTPDQIRDILVNLTPLPMPLQINTPNIHNELPIVNTTPNVTVPINIPPRPITGPLGPLPPITGLPILAPLPPITAMPPQPILAPMPPIVGLPPITAMPPIAAGPLGPLLNPLPPITAAPQIFGALPPIVATTNKFLSELKLAFTTLDKGDPETVTLTSNEKSKPLELPYRQLDPQAGFIMKILDFSQEEVSNHISTFFGHFKGTKDETIALYWWGLIYSNLNIIKGKTELNEIHKLSNDQLVNIVPNDWPYPRDRASIMFKLLTGYNPPRADATREPRYQALINTSPIIIQRLAKYVYNYFGPEQYNSYEFYSQYTPYRHVALQQISVLEPFVIQYSSDKVDYFAGRMGMIIPNNVNKEQYYFDNMKHYTKILTRNPKRLFPVPDLENKPTNTIDKLLEPYTDEELLDGYEISNRYYVYKGRIRLISDIKNERSRTNNVWQFRKNHCLNADRNNIFELEPRVDTLDDPIISYGTMKNYRCWNKSELEELWNERGGIFSFTVPDWKLGDPYKTFPAVSIRELKELLFNTGNPIFNQLIGQIDLGLEAMTNANVRIKTYRDHYLKLSKTDQNLVIEYLIWLFLTSMYMRFWKGPGNPYPEVWVEGGGGNELCDITQRTENVNKQFLVRSRILEKMKPEIEQWVLSFPRIEYNFKEGTSAVGAETINFIVEEAQMGNFCLAEASDHLVQTSYYLLTRILNINLAGFNQTVNKHLSELDPNLANRQRDFNPLATTGTRHVDPHHRLQKF